MVRRASWTRLIILFIALDGLGMRRTAMGRGGGAPVENGGWVAWLLRPSGSDDKEEVPTKFSAQLASVVDLGKVIHLKPRKKLSLRYLAGIPASQTPSQH